jgi:hypothetical protein
LVNATAVETDPRVSERMAGGIGRIPARHEPPDLEIAAARAMAEHTASFDRQDEDNESDEE